jgi:hypothetical protein
VVESIDVRVKGPSDDESDRCSITSNDSETDVDSKSESDDALEAQPRPKQSVETVFDSLKEVHDRLKYTAKLCERVEILVNWCHVEPWHSVRILGYLASCGWKNRDVALNDKVDGLFEIKPTPFEVRAELKSLSENDRSWDLSVGQLICLNRLFQFIDYHHSSIELNRDFVSSARFFDEWVKRVFLPARQFIDSCTRKRYTDKSLFTEVANLYASATLFDGLGELDERCTSTEFESLKAWMSNLLEGDSGSSKGREYLRYLCDSASGFSFPFFDCLFTGNQIRELTNLQNITPDLVKTLAVHFPNSTYIYGCPIVGRKRCFFLLVNFPILIRHAVARYFRPTLCVFEFDRGWTTFDRLQRLEYAMCSSLARVYENSLDLLETERQNSRALHLKSTDVSPNLAYSTNYDVLNQVARIPTSFYRSTRDLIPTNMKSAHSVDGVWYDEDLLVKSSDGGFEWLKGSEKIRGYEECLSVVRSSMLHTYWGSFTICDIFSVDSIEVGKVRIPILVAEMYRRIMDLESKCYPEDSYDRSGTFTLIGQKLRNNAPSSQRRGLYVCQTVVESLGEIEGAGLSLKYGLSKTFYFLSPSNAVKITSNPKGAKLVFTNED